GAQSTATVRHSLCRGQFVARRKNRNASGGRTPGFERIMERYPLPLDDTTVGGQAMLSRQVVQYSPVFDNPAAPSATKQFARDFDFNSVIFAPMFRQDKVIGAIGTARRWSWVFGE